MIAPSRSGDRRSGGGRNADLLIGQFQATRVLGLNIELSKNPLAGGLPAVMVLPG
jgi:hypothetical protein